MRKWTPYEFNLLLEFGFDPFSLASQVDLDIPVEYIVGKCKFYGYTFSVTQDTFIPRVETEQLIQIAVEYVVNNLDYVEFWDVGCGCGNIGITFANELKKIGIKYTGYLVDKSQNALLVAQKNSEEFGLDLNFLHQDLKNINFTEKTNLILANLPYIPTERISKLNKSVKNYEPITALDGGEDGLDLIRILINRIMKLEYLKFAVLEVDDTHTSDKYFANLPMQALKDFNGKNRFWVISKD